jgi:hypothetical protein
MYYVFFILGRTIIIDELDYDWFLHVTMNSREKYLNYLQ